MGVLKTANEEKRGVPLQVFSRAMALVRSLTVSKTNNCLLAAAGTFCNKCIQLSVLLISPKWSICCTEKDCLSGSRKDNREKHMERKREEHRSDGEFGSLNSTCIKAGEKQDLWWWWGGESGAYVIWILERGKIGQDRKDGQSLECGWETKWRSMKIPDVASETEGAGDSAQHSRREGSLGESLCDEEQRDIRSTWSQ